MARNESSDFQQAISYALQRLTTPRMVLKPEQRAVSKLSTVRLHFAHLRFSKPSSSFVMSNRALILDAQSFLASSFSPNSATLRWLQATKDLQKRHTDAIFTI